MSAPLQRSFHLHNLAIVISSVLLVVGLGGWAATTEFAGAVIAQGQIVVNSNVKKVQHPTGGIVGELHVRDGDHVKAGDIVVRLDDTQTRASLARRPSATRLRCSIFRSTCLPAWTIPT
jgi:HlyD family secretion protein